MKTKHVFLINHITKYNQEGGKFKTKSCNLRPWEKIKQVTLPILRF